MPTCRVTSAFAAAEPAAWEPGRHGESLERRERGTPPGPGPSSAAAPQPCRDVIRDAVGFALTRPERRDRIDSSAEGSMTSEIRTLCDIFLSAAASGKPDLLISKVGGAWRPISASDFGFTVRALSLGLNSLGLAAGRPRRDPLGEPARVGHGRLRHPVRRRLVRARSTRRCRPARSRALLKDCAARAIFVSTRRAAREDPGDPGAVPGPRVRRHDRGRRRRRSRAT